MLIPLSVDALCASPNKRLQPTTAPADPRHRYSNDSTDDMNENSIPVCWWCRERSADSNEHRWPRSLIKKLYGPGSYVSGGESQPIHVSGEIQRQVRSAGARLLTYRSSLCARCNNERSQQFDSALIDFFHYAIDNRKQIIKSQEIDFSEVYGSSWSMGINALLSAFAKDMGCRFVDSGMEVPVDIVALLNDGWEAYPIIETYIDLNLGILSTFEDTSSFLGKSDLEAVLSAEDRSVRAVSYFYTVSYLRCFVGYHCRERLVNVDRLHPKKQRVYVSWGSVLSEERLLIIRATDKEIGYNDIIDVTGRRLVRLPNDQNAYPSPVK